MNQDEDRPNPEELMEAIRIESRISQKGRLKIFLGMAAGVGKTYAMLEAAQLLKRQGLTDVVVGTVDTHGRLETAALLEGLEIIPEKEIIYKSNVLKELDLDAILKRRPQLVLVDELAHSNIPGSRHLKRWQDVMEILENGIDVYTTLNVQHIESVKDVVENITEIGIRESVPDVIIDSATYIELIDLAPDELLQRLKEGKVYLGEQAEIAARNFFLKDRLTALREIILRYTAEKVEHDLKGLVSSVTRYEGWKPREKLLVAVGPNPLSKRLIRICRRLAYNLGASWIALYVDTGKYLDDQDLAELSKNLALARDLGAEVITTNDPDIVDGIQRVARQKGVTQIIIGRPPRKLFLDFFKRTSIIDRLERESTEIDIHIIRQPPHTKYYYRRFPLLRLTKQFSSYFSIFLSVAVISGINYWLVVPIVGYRVVGLMFLIAILFSSLFFRKGPIFFGSILYALIWDYAFVPPLFTVMIRSQEDTLLLGLFFFTAVVTGILVDRERENKLMIIKREQMTESRYEIVQDIATAPSSDLLFESINKRLGTLLNGHFEILVKNTHGGLAFTDASPIGKEEKEKNAALWVIENGKEAGWSTFTLPMAKNLFIPLKGMHEIVGILAFQPNDVNKFLSIEEKNLLYSVAQQLANNLERSFAEERRRQMDYLHNVDKIHQKILKLISKGFEKSLGTIQEAIKELKNEQTFKGVGMKQLNSIESSANTLHRILENISVMAKLTGELGPLHLTNNDIYALIEACCENFKKTSDKHILKINLQENLPLVSFDLPLVKLALSNLIDNAAQYSPQGCAIEIQAFQNQSMLVISILDQGHGIPPNLIETIFEKFYRMPGTKTPGIGLGLPLAKTIAEIHHGSLKAENRETGGAKFSLSLPM